MDNIISVIKKWYKMLSGNSVFHIRQLAGKHYDKKSVKGYYSDLRHKVSGDTLLDEIGVPINITSNRNTIYFSITIFQYGLGAYDLYLETRDDKFLKKFNICVEWAMKNQDSVGRWDAFSFKNEKEIYSSMAQGEGASLLIRAYVETKEQNYLIAAKKALDFMLMPIEEGGTTIYKNESEFTFEESTSSDYRTILNGMVFSIWGLWDYILITGDNQYREILENSALHLANILHKFDCGYWSSYDLSGNIASPFYHDLHIEQLKVMYDLFSIEEYKQCLDRWVGYKNSTIKSKKAFMIKAVQKLRNIKNDVTLVR